MSLIVDPFSDDSIFGLVALTDEINLIPNTYGRLNKSGLFNFKGVATKSIIVELKNNIVRILPSQERGGDKNHARHGKRNGVTLDIPHINLVDQILPDEYIGKRSFGTTDQLETIGSVMADKLMENHLSFELTWENLMWGAVKGIIYDSDGSTILCDLFNKFEIPKNTINFKLDDPDTDVLAICRELTRYTKKNLYGDTMSGIRCPVSPEFFDALVGHKNVEKFWIGHQESCQHAQVDPREGFKLQGVIFEEFEGEAPNVDGGVTRFIEEGKGHTIPEGTLRTFKGVYGPAGFTETVNTDGEAIYVRQKPRDFNLGIDIYMESNPLPYCTNPRVLSELVMSQEAE